MGRLRRPTTSALDRMEERLSGGALSSEEGFHNGFFHFMEAVTILSCEPEVQCACVGDYNVAWELKHDVSAGSYLLGRGFLQPDEEASVRELVRAVAALDVGAMPGGQGREPNLQAMEDPQWSSLRLLARLTREQLSEAAHRTTNYLEGGDDAI